MMKTKRWCKH